MTTTADTHPDDVRVIPEWELCDRLARSMRLVRNMTQSDMADVLGVRRETVSRWVSGHNKPSRAVLLVWSDLTGVDADWLIGEEAVNYEGPRRIEGLRDLRARRDSNPKPSDLYPRTLRVLPGGAGGVKVRLTADRPVGLLRVVGL